MYRIMRSWGFIAAVLLVVGSMAFPSFSAADTVYNVNKKGVAIKGYDPVAYFTEKMPAKGSKMYEMEWEGAKWWFASQRTWKCSGKIRQSTLLVMEDTAPMG